MEEQQLLDVLRSLKKHELESIGVQTRTVLREKYPSSKILKKTRRPRNLSKVMNVEECAQIIRWAPHETARRVFLLQLVFALRASELSRLTLQDGLLYIYAQKTRTTEVLPVPDSARWLVEGVDAFDIHPNTIGNWFRAARSAAGLAHSWGRDRAESKRLFRFYNHCLRHTGIDWMRVRLDGNPWRLSAYSRHDLSSRFGALAHYQHRYSTDEIRADLQAVFGAFLDEHRRSFK